MCGSIPAPLSATPTMPSNVGAAGGGAVGKTEGGGAPDKTEGGGAPQKAPTTGGGGAADGAANLQLQSVLTSLVQAVKALSELLAKQTSGLVAGANGGGATTTAGGPDGKEPGQLPTQVPTQVPTQGGGPEPKGGGPAQKDSYTAQKGGGPQDCGTPPPVLTGGGASNSAADPHAGMAM
jgi:hypothetical protein